MLPVASWLQAMNTEATLPQRTMQTMPAARVHSGLRRAVGRGLIAVGVALAGEPINRSAWAAK